MSKPVSKPATKPVVALTLGDAAGIGPELIAKLLSQPDITAKANIVLVGDAWLWQEGQAIAKLSVPTQPVQSWAEARTRPDHHLPAFLAVNTLDPASVQRSQAQAVCGKSVLSILNFCMDAAKAGVNAVHIIDGRVPHALLLEVLGDQPFGTMIRG